MASKVFSAAITGIDAQIIEIEGDISFGLKRFEIVGLPDKAVNESGERVRAALIASGLSLPPKRITINLAPADLPKEGSRFDLPIAIGILAASGQIPVDKLEQFEFIGELALSGELREVRGVLPAAVQCRDKKRKLVLPQQNAHEAALVSELEICHCSHLLQVCAKLNGQEDLINTLPTKNNSEDNAIETNIDDLSDVIGQHHAKRAIEIAAAGGHNLVLLGPPGTGKTMLATRLPGILPLMTEKEALESAAIQSIRFKGFTLKIWKKRIFRAPHHTASGVALVGGGCHFQQ